MTMTNDERLRAILRAQEVKPDGAEMKALQAARADVEALLRANFDACSPTIRYGGSKAKGTMLLDDFDLDIICYFPREDTAAGKTIEEIYGNVRKALEKKYRVDPRTTALRVLDADKDLHIDVVPGRFIDGDEGDAFLHQNGRAKDKERLKTNLEKHIKHVVESGCVEDIRLAKLWKRKSGLSIRTFPLELIVIKVLKGSRLSGFDARFKYLLGEIVDKKGEIAIEDPANAGNDVGEMLTDIREGLTSAAGSTLLTAERSGWSAIFGTGVPASSQSAAAALRVSVGRSEPIRPWAHDN
jgi:hypothetical protein